MNFNDFYNVLLEANPAKRMDYLRSKYGSALNELLTKYIINVPTNAVDMFRNMFGMDFVQYIVDRIDPQKGVYSEWIIKNLLKENFNPTTFDRFLTEDFYKVYEDLEKYHKYKRLFKTLGEALNNPNTVKLGDINQIKSFDDLYEKLRLLKPYIEAEEEKETLKAAEKDVEKIYNSDNYLILTPKTQEASCAYGRNTRWCTASTGSYNYFNQYNKQGPLYIIINKNFNKKYQFHFQSEQYMDEDDDPIDMSSFLRNNPEIAEFIIDLAFKNGNLKFVRENANSQKIIEKLETADESLKIKIIKDDFVIAYLIGLKEPELVNNNQKVLKFVEPDKVELDSGVKTFFSIFDYVMDEDDAWRSERIIYRDPDWFRGDLIKYEDEYWDWLDESNFELVKRYCKNQYPISFKELGNSEDLTKDEVKRFLEDKEDSHVNDALTDSYRLIYQDASMDSMGEDIFEAVYKKLSSEFYYNDQNYIIFKIPYSRMNSIIKDFENYPEHIPPTDKNYFLSNYSEVLKEDNDLASPNFRPDPDVRSDDEQQYTVFNSDFRDSFDVGEDQRNKNQLKFDLSGVSRDMNNFDGYVFEILKELNMAKGGISNQSGDTNQPQNSTAGSNPPPSVSSNPSTKVNQPMTTGTNKSLGQNNTSGQQYNPDEMDKMVLDKGTDFNNLLQDPDTSTAVFQHISSSLADPNYKNRVALQTTLKNNQAFNKAYSDYIRQYKPLNTP
jgi:hypothetical protein